MQALKVKELLKDAVYWELYIIPQVFTENIQKFSYNYSRTYTWILQW